MLYEGRDYEPEALVALLDREIKSAKPSKTLLDKLGANPKTRASLLRLMKENDPALAIPEIDAAQPVLDEIKALREEREAEKKATREAEEKRAKEDQDRETARAIETGRALLQRKGYQKEGIEKVEELMKSRNLPDYEAAMALFERDQPKDRPAIPSNLNRSWELFGPAEEDKDATAAVTLPKGRAQENALQRATMKEVAKALQDIRGAA